MLALTLISITGFAVAAWLLYQLMLQNGRILGRLEQLERTSKTSSRTSKRPFSYPPGAVLHDFELPCLDGGTMTLSEWQGRCFLLIFLHPDCPFSASLIPHLAGPSIVPVVVVSTGDPQKNRALLTDNGVTHPVLIEEDREVADFLSIRVTPSGYMVNEHGRTIGDLLAGPAELADAMRRGPLGYSTTPIPLPSSVIERLERGEPTLGTPAPNFDLPDLSARSISLAAFAGKPLLLVFSDPTYAPCRELAPRLEALHRNGHGVPVLMVSRGTAESNREMAQELGLTFPIALQSHREVARKYGTLSMPAGCLLDADRRFTGPIAIGQSAIEELIAGLD